MCNLTLEPTAPEATVDAPAYAALADVASDLRAADDVQRRAALDFITAKTTGQTATEVGQAMIEEIARLAQEQAAVYQVGTQFEWALHGIVYDEPAWVDTWAAAANANTHAPALRILNHMQRQTPEVVQAALACWPPADPAVQEALLHSLSWLARSGVKELPAALRATVSSWLLERLAQADNPAITQALAKVLGYWPCNEQHIDRIQALQAHLQRPDLSQATRGALYRALALQVAEDEPAAAHLEPWLRARLAEPAARPAWVRLQMRLVEDPEVLAQQVAAAVGRSGLYPPGGVGEPVGRGHR